jgi:hypothetical protein
LNDKYLHSLLALKQQSSCSTMCQQQVHLTDSIPDLGWHVATECRCDCAASPDSSCKDGRSQF